MFSNDDLIYAYTRQQALADGVLVDVTAMAREGGFRIPVALTAAAWAECVAVPPGVIGQDEPGRLWDVLSVLRYSIPKYGNERELMFRLYVQTRNDADPDLVELKAVCGPDDDGSPCLTVMTPTED